MNRSDHISNRDRIILSLREELVGPSPRGKEIDPDGPITFNEVIQSYGPWKQKGSGEEILQRDSPVKRYGIGVLYPVGTQIDEDETVLLASDSPTGAELNDEEKNDRFTLEGDEQFDESIEQLRKGIAKSEEAESDDFDISTANTYKPSSMAISFLAEFPAGSELVIEASGGRYIPKEIQVADQTRIWWLRQPIGITARFDGKAVRKAKGQMVAPVSAPEKTNLEGLDVRVELFARPFGENGNSLLTVCFVNRTASSLSVNTFSIFQAHLKAWVVQNDGHRISILPYPKVLTKPENQNDPELDSLSLLYRNDETYAVGHGCAANWEVESRKAVSVSGECLPQFEAPSVTSDTMREDGSLVEVSMAKLAGLIEGDDGFSALREVVDSYRKWIEQKKTEIGNLPQQHQRAAREHMRECESCADRMTDGIAFLETNPQARLAFQLANRAILLQQVRGRREPRRASYNRITKRIVYSEPYQLPTDVVAPPGRGNWRAFQIAFILMSVRSAADPEDADRRTVELIWFPTGGGKTESYLGLAAFTLFIRRLRNAKDSGVHVLMRYTLRLLTAQQFQRASSLICSMEYLRRQDWRLGNTPFSIGIWVGGSTTPNTREQALQALTRLRSGNRFVENPFLLSRCPWCRAQMGPLEYQEDRPRRAPRIIGYEPSGDTVILKCPDPNCEFEFGLPVYVIDEDIYDVRPSLVIGTVDKFAMLAWRPTARSLFGIDREGNRETSPPGLIIQDELHLISGPLGSLVGLYESVIEEFCTDRRSLPPVVPKIVSSTATIRRYRDQIKALYARDKVTLFPPSGLEASDSFFARYAQNADGDLSRGRIYVGIHAPALGSLQTAQVRTFTSALQAPVTLTRDERDPWWTLLLFFNSLRELGTTLSLFQSDIPNYFGVIQQRYGIPSPDVRKFYKIKELTGRLRSDEVPEAISALEVTCTNDSTEPVDVCLASNIIEVGVDIDRLSLMSVVGQPKTTSQYIQVTGRVGRLWTERPGLVLTIYGASKPRDRSHFEKFRSYHEKLYAQVEPTSVTPFSPPVLDRALHAIISVYARQLGDAALAESPYPYPSELIAQLRDLLLPRIRMIDSAEEENFLRVFNQRASEWERWERTRWTRDYDSQGIPLLREAGEYVDRLTAKVSWATPQSMRNVDAECQVEITQLFITEEERSA